MIFSNWMKNWNEDEEGITITGGEYDYDCSTTKAYDDGCLAGDRYMEEGGTGPLPMCPYLGSAAKEWENGFNCGAGEVFF